MAPSGSTDPAILPAWSLSLAASVPSLRADWPLSIDREWAWGDATGRGVRVCIVDSGVEAGHPLVGELASASAVEVDGEDVRVVPDEQGDVAGHGTACAGIVRSIAPDCELHSVRVLGPTMTGRGSALVAGLEWAVGQGFDVVNLSLSTRKTHVAAEVLPDGVSLVGVELGSEDVAETDLPVLGDRGVDGGQGDVLVDFLLDVIDRLEPEDAGRHATEESDHDRRSGQEPPMGQAPPSRAPVTRQG